MIRWRDIQSASFQLWNANFFNIYRKKGGIDVLIHSRPYDANWDRAEVHEFVFVADRLAVNSLRKFSKKIISGALSTLSLTLFILNFQYQDGARDVNNI